MFVCEKCGKPGSARQLAGGRVVTLCNECANKWIEWLCARPEWRRYRGAAMSLEARVHVGDLRKLPDLLDAVEKAEEALYELSGQWLRGG